MLIALARVFVAGAAANWWLLVGGLVVYGK